MKKNQMLIQIDIVSLGLIKEYNVPTTFTVQDTIDAIKNLIKQELGQLNSDDKLDLYTQGQGFLEPSALINDIIVFPSERVYLI